jgi:hypothetical protein
MKIAFVAASIVIAVMCNAWFVAHALSDSVHEISAYFQGATK